MNHRQAETTSFSSAPLSACARETCIHTLFEAQANRAPDAVALVFEGRKLTYRKLDRRTNQLAHYIQKLGVGPDVPVGIYLERSTEMIVSLLAVLKAGGAYLPLDPAYPKDRLTFMLQDTQVAVLLTRAHLLKRTPAPPYSQALKMVCLDSDWQTIARESEEHLIDEVTADNLAYVLYTSGSTGKPKGVMIEHRHVTALLRGFEQVAPTSEQLVGTSVCPFGFDVSVWECFSTLCFGGTLHVLAPEVLVSVERFSDYLADWQVTSAYVPPALLNGVADQMEKLRGQIQISLDRILVGVEPIKQSVLQRFRELIAHIRIVNGYGPTETTICATLFNFGSVVEPERRTPIGTAVPGYRVYLVDPQLEPVPIDVPGEILIGGPGLARGYLHRPALTAEKFIPLPPALQASPSRVEEIEGGAESRLYKTGDLARYLPDGNIEFLGRSDHQVKIRGFRVELGEIESVLGQHPALQEAVVLARENTSGDKYLVAYIVPADRKQGTKLVSELRSYLKHNLPEHMVPSAFVTLEALPLTTNGKVNRQALPAPAWARPELEEIFVAPRTPVEKQLAQIWTQVLGYEQIGIHDSFFNLGGHSLALTQVLARVLECFQVELPMASFFETPTVAGLAEHIERASQMGIGQELPAITSVPRDGPLPLTFAQEQVWFLQELVPDNVAYNAQVTVRFKGELDVATFKRALSEIVRRHEILRTTVSVAGGQPTQIIHPPWTVGLPLVDLCAIPENRREIEMERLVKAASRRPFDTTQLPLIHWTLFRLGAQDHVFAQIEHHFVHDGWSFAVLLRELKALYQAFVADKPSPLAELPIQFADFAVWQRRWMQGEMLQVQLAYWKKQLAGSPPVLELPTDRPRPKVQRFRGAAHTIALSPQLHEALKALSLREGVTLFMTLLAACKVLLYRYTGQNDILVGSGFANRRLRETEGLIGMIVNAVMLRSDLSGNPTFRELLGRVREMALGAYTHQELPFEKLVQALQPERDLSHNPLFQVMFSFHDSAVPELTFAGLTGTIHYRQNDSTKCDLNILVVPRAEQLLGRSSAVKEEWLTIIWEYDTDLFDATTIERLARHFQVLLEGITATKESLDQRISALPLLTNTERQQLLDQWSGTETAYPREKTIQQLFEVQVEQAPDTVAVVFEEQQLTYQELNCRANQLAHRLQTLCVEPEVLVGIFMERSPEMVIAHLGILKAGGAYLPLDPEYPPQRLAFMLQDAQVRVLLTQTHLTDKLPSPPKGRTTLPTIICLDTGWETLAVESQENPDHQATAENLAYVMYTSGSTGWPKGTSIVHRGVVRLVKETNFADLSARQVFLQLAPISFDAATLELWGALLNGGRLAIMSAYAPSLAEIGQALTQYQVTTLWLTASLFHLMVDERLEDLQHLRQLLAGGDVLSIPHVRRVVEELKQGQMINGYGPTENTTFSTCYPVLNPNGIHKTVPIGYPVANSQVYILDARLQPVPAGVPGNLYVGGDGLARGYLNRPDLTAESFIPASILNGKPAQQRKIGTRLYKTGDLTRFLPDGSVEFLGRRDFQIKLRGFRIELGEIQTVLAQHPGVRDVVVLARDAVRTPNDKRLVAYVVPADAAAIPHPSSLASELQSCLKKKLPDYMVPSAFVFMDAFPMSPVGKVDRHALPTPDQSDQKIAEAFVAPRSLSEEVMADIWAEVLDLERVGVHDDFFALGGHSLLATQIVSRLRNDLQVEIRLRDFFASPTIAQLALAVEDVLLAELETLTDQEAQSLIEGE